MRRYFILFLVINVASVYALIGGAGIHVVQDQFTIEESNATYADVNFFTTSELTNPIGLGGFMYLTIIPLIDFEGGYNITVQKYNFGYPDLGEQEFGIGKATWYASVQYPFFSPPTMRVYIGAGANGTEWLEPITYETLETLDEQGKAFDDKDAILDAVARSSSGYHFEMGARFKPPLFPMSFNGNIRYIMDKDFHSTVEDYLMISLGLAFAI